ncbi:hypothetical protein CUJ84_pRLN1000048 (plasmid) [Rhizobium leguminosarum]|uniref:Uncharacterized protein n=1 Tax=Rhizobium leguminosarum TaxID=384 RepID=A0A2K9ZB85_RHILE|nr:hypothetical protein CUJ84_pRLN1000048 [Rhizobium leguminosarum]
MSVTAERQRGRKTEAAHDHKEGRGLVTGHVRDARPADRPAARWLVAVVLLHRDPTYMEAAGEAAGSLIRAATANA